MSVLSMFGANSKIEKSVKRFMENDPEIKEQFEKLQLMVIKKYMSDTKTLWYKYWTQNKVFTKQ